MTKSFSSISNAVRGFRATNTTTLTGPELRNLVVELDGRYWVELAVTPEPVVIAAKSVLLKGVPMTHSSTMRGAVARAKELFGEYAELAGEDMSRKGAIAHAVANGVAFFTARTQYQVWSKSFG